MEHIDLSKRPAQAPTCMDCGSATVLTLTDNLYPDEPELHGDPAWQCACGAHARCKPGTLMPASIPAGKTTREARRDAYAAYLALSDALPDVKIGRRKLNGKKQAIYVAAKAARVWVGKFSFGNLTAERARAVADSLRQATPR